MQLRRRQTESDEPAGAPEWMVTFSDCMTLLLTFFVLLLSFSSFDEHTFRKLKVIFSKSMPTVSRPLEEGKDAFLESRKQIRATEDIDEGSEKPTLARGWQDNTKEETEPEDFRRRKVFLIPSRNIFWAKGTIISPKGRETLSTMAMFLKEVPSRLVISENGPGDNQGSKHFGLPRAWTVMHYLTAKQGLDKKWFSLSATSTIDQSEPDSPGLETERKLEIILLERSIYN